MEQEIINRVAQSGLITIDPADFLPAEEIHSIDIADVLEEGILLREKKFREYISAADWSIYKDKNVALFCSGEAIIPEWAWMLLSSALQPFAASLVVGNPSTLVTLLALKKIESTDFSLYKEKRIIVKGCGDKEVPSAVYAALTANLVSIASSVMYGEPCSTVPVYKKGSADR